MGKLKNEIGSFMVQVGGLWMQAKIVHDSGELDVVSLGGDVPFGPLSKLEILTEQKSGAATRRLIESGDLSHGRMNFISARWMVSAKKSVHVGLSAFLRSRYGPEGWVTEPKALAKGQALLVEALAIEATEG
jgi:hypothetical protein